MAIGIRLRGDAGQFQVSDERPVFMQLYQGSFDPSQYQPSGGAADYRHMRVIFPAPITTAMPPLVFIRPTNHVTSFGLRLLGGQGNWVGFMVSSTEPYDPNTQAFFEGNARAMQGTWYVAASSVPKSNAPVGIRIRNKNTNEVIFDTGYPLVKFISFVPTFSKRAYPGFFGQYSYNTPVPGGESYLLGNTMGGVLSNTAGGQYGGIMYITFNQPDTAGNLLISCYAYPDNSDVYMRSYAWTVLWAYRGL